MTIEQLKFSRAARVARIKAQAVGHTVYQRLSLTKGEGIASRQAAYTMRAVYRGYMHTLYRIRLRVAS